MPKYLVTGSVSYCKPVDDDGFEEEVEAANEDAAIEAALDIAFGAQRSRLIIESYLEAEPLNETKVRNEDSDA